MGIIKPLHVRQKYVGMMFITTEVKHTTVNVSEAFVITSRFICSVGTSSGTAKCKHCLGVNTHIRRMILSGMHCEIKKKINKTPLQKQYKKISNQRKMSSVRPLLSLERQTVWFGHWTG
jgi:hypothetical protein